MMSWPYIAGFFDGEGTVRLNFAGRREGKFIFYQSERRVLTAIQDFLASAGIDSRLPRSYSSGPTGKARYALVISRMDSMMKFAHVIIPYLRVKKAAIQDLLRFRKLYPTLTPSQFGNLAWENRDKVMTAIRKHYADKGGHR